MREANRKYIKNAGKMCHLCLHIFMPEQIFRICYQYRMHLEDNECPLGRIFFIIIAQVGLNIKSISRCHQDIEKNSQWPTVHKQQHAWEERYIDTNPIFWNKNKRATIKLLIYENKAYRGNGVDTKQSYITIVGIESHNIFS